MQTKIGWPTFFVVVLLGGSATLILKRPVRLGVDLRGGTQVVLEASGVSDPDVAIRVLGRTAQLTFHRVLGIAHVVALAVQVVYLAVRFRWTFGAVAAMFHDVAILLGIFAWLGKEIDGAFLAALLTVIGYSINDSVVVFDRIRKRCMAVVLEKAGTGVGAPARQGPRTVRTATHTARAGSPRPKPAAGGRPAKLR